MRIVSLCPSLTELVFDVGRGDELVGITEWCVHPEDARERIETVGGTKDPDVDRIIELRPDLVLMNEEENRRQDAEALRQAGLDCHVSFPKTAGDAAAMVRSIGRALERGEEAERIARDIEARAERVRFGAEDLAPIRYAYVIWRKPWMAAGPDTFVHGLLSLAGGRNVFAGGGDRYPTFTAEELAAADPAAVLMATEPLPFRSRHLEELADAAGLPEERFRIVDGELLSWHGSRTPAGIDYAERVLSDFREGRTM